MTKRAALRPPASCSAPTMGAGNVNVLVFKVYVCRVSERVHLIECRHWSRSARVWQPAPSVTQADIPGHNPDIRPRQCATLAETHTCLAAKQMSTISLGSGHRRGNKSLRTAQYRAEETRALVRGRARWTRPTSRLHLGLGPQRAGATRPRARMGPINNNRSSTSWSP